MRSRPNILVSGTPGTGKSTTCAQVAQATGLTHLCLGDLVKEQGLHEGWDEEFQCFVVDEDKVCDYLEGPMKEGGVVLDYHACDFFPERWFDLIVVLQTDNSVLHDRLTARGYSGRKLHENMECEIMQVLLDEARCSYDPDKVLPLSSNTTSDLEANIARIRAWVEKWEPQGQYGKDQ